MIHMFTSVVLQAQPTVNNKSSSAYRMQLDELVEASDFQKGFSCLSTELAEGSKPAETLHLHWNLFLK
jgi:O-acetyl-ADP-ribose deacetylase (regulator of RNase III)